MKRIWAVLAIVLILSLIVPVAQAYDPKPPGDINWDDQVNENDLNLLKEAYLSYPASRKVNYAANVRWNPRADFNKDGIVNAVDFSIMGVNWKRW